MAALGIKDITICARLPVLPMIRWQILIEGGVVTGIQSLRRARHGLEAISHGEVEKSGHHPLSHGGRVRGPLRRGCSHRYRLYRCADSMSMVTQGRSAVKSDCRDFVFYGGCKICDNVVVITDCLVPAPNYPSAEAFTVVDVDYVCVVDEIGNPGQDCQQRSPHDEGCQELMMAQYCTQDIAKVSVFQRWLFFQTGGGGVPGGQYHAAPDQDGKRHSHGICYRRHYKPICDFSGRGLVRNIVRHDFELGAIESIKRNPNHYEISTLWYAEPHE